jgi:hypothetical protein
MQLKGKIFVLNPDIVYREEEEGAFLFNPQTEALHGINRVGSSICKLLDGKNNLDNIHEAILEQYDVDVEPNQLKKDVKSFFERLAALNLLIEKE